MSAFDLLVELELDPTRQLLAASALTGVTAERWARVEAELQGAWAAKLAGSEPAPEAGERARALLSEVSAAWDAFVPRLRALAQPLGTCPALERLTGAVSADPLGDHEAELAALEDAAAAIRDFPARLAALRTLAAEAGELYSAARERIAGFDGPPPPAVDDPEWTQLRGLEDAAGRSLAAARGALDARRELRGLLDAYHAKAAALRALEDPGQAERYQRAHTALFTRPTDLAAATALVHAYRDGLR